MSSAPGLIIQTLKEWYIKQISSLKNNKPFSKAWVLSGLQLTLAVYLIRKSLQRCIKAYTKYKLSIAPFQPRVIIIGAGLEFVQLSSSNRTKLY